MATHGITGYTYGCRCDICRTARRVKGRRDKRRSAGTLASDDPRHGTYNGYNNYACRCTACMQARIDYYAERVSSLDPQA